MNSYKEPKIMETFSRSEQEESMSAQDEMAANSSPDHSPLIGLREKELYQLKLHDSEAFFRESYRKKVLGNDEKVPVYYTKEARKRVAQHKLSERLVAHLNKENS